MPQLRNERFRFNGVDSEFHQVYLCVVNNDAHEGIYGMERSVNTEEGIGDIPLFLGFKDECQSFDVEICKYRNGNIIKISDKELEDMARWLFKKEIGCLECNGLVYYGYFARGTRWDNGASQGYITLTFTMTSPYCYSPIMNSPTTIKGTKTIELFNKSTNGDEFIYPDIEMQLVGQHSTITIENLTTQETVVFSGLESGEWIYCYNDGLKQIVSKIDSKRNLYPKFNKKWLSMKYGKNVIKVTSSNSTDAIKFNILFQNKIALY